MTEQPVNVLNLQQGDENILHEIDGVETDNLIKMDFVPSQFKGYPKNTRIYYKPVTLGELETLNNAEIDTTRGMAMLLNSIHCNTLKSYDLYFWDVIFTGIQRKLLAFGEITGTLYKLCPKCGGTVTKSFKYTELDLKEIDAPDLPLCIEICGKEMEFAPLTMKQFLQMDTKEGQAGVLSLMCRNIPYEEVLPIIKNASGIDLKKLKYVDYQLAYGILPFYVKCENVIDVNGKSQVCGENVKVEVRSPFEIVFPEDFSGGYNEFQVTFGKR